MQFILNSVPFSRTDVAKVFEESLHANWCEYKKTYPKYSNVNKAVVTKPMRHLLSIHGIL